MISLNQIIKLAEKFETKTKFLYLNKLIVEGISDQQLDYLRDGMRNLISFDATYQQGMALGLTSTEIANGSFYDKNGHKFGPIEIIINSKGKMFLQDGRHRYITARKYKAHSILAKIKQYNTKHNLCAEITTNLKFK